MVTIAPKEKGWSDVGEAFGTGFVSSYQNRSDELAIQDAISRLPENATMKERLAAITGAKTYKPEAKQQVIKNMLDIGQYEELERHHKATEETARLNKSLKDTEKNDKIVKEKNEVGALYKEMNPEATPEDIEDAKNTYSVETMRRKLDKDEKTEYKTAENFSKRIEPTVKTITENAEKADKSLAAVETALEVNEKYTAGEKFFDNAINAIDSPFLKPLKSTSGQQIEAYSPYAVAALSEKMSGVMSVRKINLIMSKAAAPDKSKESNRLFMYMDLYDKKIDQLKKQFSDEIIENSKFGLAPKDFDKRLKEKMTPYLKMIDEDIGLLLNGKMPSSPMSETNISKAKKNTPEGRTLVMRPEKSADGTIKNVPTYIKSNLVGTEQYKDWMPL